MSEHDTSEIDEVLNDIKKAAKLHGWAVFVESKPDKSKGWLIQLIDVSDASFEFPYDEIVESPPPLGIHVVEGIAGADKVGG